MVRHALLLFFCLCCLACGPGPGSHAENKSSGLAASAVSEHVEYFNELARIADLEKKLQGLGIVFEGEGRLQVTCDRSADREEQVKSLSDYIQFVKGFLNHFVYQNDTAPNGIEPEEAGDDPLIQKLALAEELLPRLEADTR